MISHLSMFITGSYLQQPVNSSTAWHAMQTYVAIYFKYIRLLAMQWPPPVQSVLKQARVYMLKQLRKQIWRPTWKIFYMQAFIISAPAVAVHVHTCVCSLVGIRFFQNRSLQRCDILSVHMKLIVITHCCNNKNSAPVICVIAEYWSPDIAFVIQMSWDRPIVAPMVMATIES